MIYNPKHIVGEFGEYILTELFDLIRIPTQEQESRGDLLSKDGSFAVEVKTSSYRNGGVIKESQLKRFSDNKKRFYGFVFHSLENMKDNYPEEKDLTNALSVKSIYLLPYSIIRAYFDNSHKIAYPKLADPKDYYVQLNEKTAKRLFDNDIEIWKKIQLDPKDYESTKLAETVFLVTYGISPKQNVLDHFRSEKLGI